MSGEAEYRPLEGRLRGPLYSSRLYAGRDHLLKCTVAGLHENYRRFAWEDIQAVTMRPSPWYGLINLFCGLLLFVEFMFLASSGAHLARALAALPFFFLPVAAVLLVNLRKGPTCTVHLRTAVSDEWLGSLHRQKVARKVIEEMARLIHERQSRPEPAAA